MSDDRDDYEISAAMDIYGNYEPQRYSSWSNDSDIDRIQEALDSWLRRWKSRWPASLEAANRTKARRTLRLRPSSLHELWSRLDRHEGMFIDIQPSMTRTERD